MDDEVIKGSIVSYTFSPESGPNRRSCSRQDRVVRRRPLPIPKEPARLRGSLTRNPDLATTGRALGRMAVRNIAMASAADHDPRHHTQKMQKALLELRDHLRDDITNVDEPQLKAMFETSAEVLGGLAKAFEDYEMKNEAAWQ